MNDDDDHDDNDDDVKYKGLPFGKSKTADDDPLHRIMNIKEHDNPRPSRRPKQKKGNKARNLDTVSSAGLQDGSSLQLTPKANKSKGMKTRAKEERAKESSQKHNTPRQRGTKHLRAFDIPISEKFLSPEVIEITRQLSDSDLDVVDELNLSSRNLDQVNYLFSDLLHKRIKTIDISNNNLSKFPECFQLESVKRITFAANLIKKLSLKNTMSNLFALVLSSNRIQQFPSVECLARLPSLRLLNLHNNMIRYIPRECIAKLAEIGLIDLNMSSNKLKALPEEVRTLTPLRSLQLRDNNLTSLPAAITTLALTSFDVKGNKLTSPPQEVASRGFSAVLRYFQEMELESAHKKKFGSGAPERVRSCQYKLIVVGHETAGKTSSIRCLTRSVVWVSLPEGGKCYGKLCGYEDGRYEVQLLGNLRGLDLPEKAPRSERSQSGNSRAGQGSSMDEDFELLQEDDEEEGEEDGGCRRFAGRIIRCLEEDIELCGPVDQSTFSCESDKPHPPDSTIGIDIDTWKPAITYNLLKSKARKSCHPATGYEAPGNGKASLSGEYRSKHYMDGFGCFDCSESESELTSHRRFRGDRHTQRSIQADDTEKSKHRMPPRDLTLSIWDFAGQEIYHSAHEAFFSERALYLIVWDMRRNSLSDFDEYVQFWIDLIQTRAPGSSMIIVGTHMDEVPPAPAILDRKTGSKSTGQGRGGKRHGRHRGQAAATVDNVKAVMDSLKRRLDANEAARLRGIEEDIASQRGNLAELKNLRKRRPQRVGIIPVSCVQNLEGFDLLTETILRLSTPTEQTPNPFQLVNIEIPSYYMDVKDEVEAMIREDHVATMLQLHENMRERKQIGPSVERTIKHTRDAITFLSSVGEVVWFGEASRFFLNVCSGGGKYPHRGSGDKEALPENVVGTIDLPTSYSGGGGDRSGHSTLAFSPAMNGGFSLLICDEADGCGQSEASHETDSRSVTSGWEGLTETTLEMFNDTWKDVGETDSDHEKAGPKTPPLARRGLDDLIFLSPHWLLFAMKRVLTHHLEGDLKQIVDDMSDVELVHYFGENHEEHIVNGVVRWQFVEDKLLCNMDLSSRACMRTTLSTALKTLFKRFDIIIPVHTHKPHSLKSSNRKPSHLASNIRAPLSPHSSSHQYSGRTSAKNGVDAQLPTQKAPASHGIILEGEMCAPHGMDALSRLPPIGSGGSTHSSGPKQQRYASTDPEEYYLVSSLLTPVDTPCIPKYAAAGYVKLERKFILDRFVPPGLMQRIMAKTFFQFGTDPSARHNPSPSAKNCWKNAFFQSFQSDKFSVIDVWVWLEVGKGLGGEVRIAGFGNIFVSQEVISYMDRYSSAVSEILSTFPGLCCISNVVLCPVCAMHQRAEEQCGSFSGRDIKRLRDELHEMECKSLGSSPPRRKRAYSVGSDCISELSMCAEEPLMSWRQLRARCSKNGCNVSADLLTRVPLGLIDKKSISERSEQTISFLMEEIVRLSAVPSANVKHCICKVGLGYTLSSNVEHFKETMLKRLHASTFSDRRGTEDANGSGEELDHLYTMICTIRSSGVLVSIPGSDVVGATMPIVISCEHFMTDLETRTHLPKCPGGCSAIILVGDENNWLYVADAIMKGSDFPVGSRMWFEDAGNIDLPIPVGSPERQLSTSSTASSQLRIEHRPYERGFWDVSALRILCAIQPVPITTVNSVRLDILSHLSMSASSRSEAVEPIEVSMVQPQVEQSLRLMSFQRMASMSVSWGRVIQKSSEGMLLANIYGDSGSSGGAVVDREGQLVGVLSMSTLGKQVAYIEPIVPIIRVIQQHFAGKLIRTGL